MQRSVFAWANLVKAKYPEDEQYMITLTYDTEGTLGVASDWNAGDIRSFMLGLRKVVKLNAYAWVSELQRNKHLHYHLLISVHKGTYVPYADKSGLWTKGMSRTEKAKVGVYYICKYVGKDYQKDYKHFPKGARHFSVWVKEGKELLKELKKTDRQKVYEDEGWRKERKRFLYVGCHSK